MYLGTFPPRSNRAAWTTLIEVLDEDTDELVDLTGCTIVFELVDPLDCTTALSATTDNDKISITGTGTFLVSFTATDMRTLCARTYQVGCTIKNDDSEAQQLIIGSQPILYGIVA